MGGGDDTDGELAAVVVDQYRRRLGTHRVRGRRGARELIRVRRMLLVLDVGHAYSREPRITLHNEPATPLGKAPRGMCGQLSDDVFRQLAGHTSDLASTACTSRVSVSLTGVWIPRAPPRAQTAPLIASISVRRPRSRSCSIEER